MKSSTPDACKLVQIARRKLKDLRIPCEPSDDGRLLKGTLPDEGTPIVNPLSSQVLRGIRFYVEGHNKLHLTHPPVLSGVPAVEFDSHADQESLRAAIASLLNRHARTVRELSHRLQKLGFETEPGDQLAYVRAVFDVELLGTVLVKAGEDGLRLIQCTPVGGGAPVSMGELSLDLDRFDDASDVEIFLSSIAEKALRKRPPPPSSHGLSSNHRPRITVQMATPDSASLRWLLDTIGPEFFAKAPLVLAQNLILDDRPARLELSIQNQKSFEARVYVEEEQRWQGHVTPSQLGDLESFLASALQKATKEKTPVSPAAAGVDTSGLIPPVSGEVWVMKVQVLDEGSTEVRYVALNTRGSSQGAPRVLPRHVFDKVFLPQGIAHRMLVKVATVTEAYVTYRRLNTDRRPVAAPRKLPLEVFLATFIAEAADY